MAKPKLLLTSTTPRRVKKCEEINQTGKRRKIKKPAIHKAQPVLSNHGQKSISKANNHSIISPSSSKTHGLPILSASHLCSDLQNPSNYRITINLQSARDFPLLKSIQATHALLHFIMPSPSQINFKLISAPQTCYVHPITKTRRPKNPHSPHRTVPQNRRRFKEGNPSPISVAGVVLYTTISPPLLLHLNLQNRK